LLSVVLMALKPVLLHLTRGKSHGNEVDAVVPLEPHHMQFLAECLKVVFCSMELGMRRMRGSAAPLWEGWHHTVLFMVPAFVYLIMNVLSVHAARILPPPTFQLVANMKILCTAILSWAIMGRRLKFVQWLALALLTLGVTLGQWQGGGLADAPLLGLAMMCANCWLSALGGVTTERAMKAPSSSSLSVFATNIHVAVHTLWINSAAMVFLHLISTADVGGPQVLPARFPHRIELLALVNEATNGIIISLILRRLDSIAKNYAFSASIFVTVLLSTLLFGYWPATTFWLGAALTVASMVLYIQGGKSKEDESSKKAR
jgi:drug/metabolite transporter (DMT)-like permease